MAGGSPETVAITINFAAYPLLFVDSFGMFRYVPIRDDRSIRNERRRLRAGAAAPARDRARTRGRGVGCARRDGRPGAGRTRRSCPPHLSHLDGGDLDRLSRLAVSDRDRGIARRAIQP